MSTVTLPTPGTNAPILPPGKHDLKYLFVALFEDGNTLVQTPEDKSPYTRGKNTVYELLAHDDEGNPKTHPVDGKLVFRPDITLFQLEDESHRYLVDLTDGHFEVQYFIGDNGVVGIPFYIGFPPIGSKLFLSYFKRRRHHSVVSGTVQDDLSVKMDNINEQSQECEYHFGWETEDKQFHGEIILT